MPFLSHLYGTPGKHSSVLISSSPICSLVWHRPWLRCPSLSLWNDKDGHPGHASRQLPIASLIYLQSLRDWPLTAILMRNSAVIAWGEMQAFSSRKRKSAHHQAKCCHSLLTWLAVCPFIPALSPSGKVGLGLPCLLHLVHFSFKV